MCARDARPRRRPRVRETKGHFGQANFSGRLGERGGGRQEFPERRTHKTSQYWCWHFHGGVQRGGSRSAALIAKVDFGLWAVTVNCLQVCIENKALTGAGCSEGKLGGFATRQRSARQMFKPLEFHQSKTRGGNAPKNPPAWLTEPGPQRLWPPPRSEEKTSCLVKLGWVSSLSLNFLEVSPSSSLSSSIWPSSHLSTAFLTRCRHVRMLLEDFPRLDSALKLEAFHKGQKASGQWRSLLFAGFSTSVNSPISSPWRWNRVQAAIPPIRNVPPVRTCLTEAQAFFPLNKIPVFKSKQTKSCLKTDWWLSLHDCLRTQWATRSFLAFDLFSMWLIGLNVLVLLRFIFLSGLSHWPFSLAVSNYRSA